MKHLLTLILLIILRIKQFLIRYFYRDNVILQANRHRLRVAERLLYFDGGELLVICDIIACCIELNWHHHHHSKTLSWFLGRMFDAYIWNTEKNLELFVTIGIFSMAILVSTMKNLRLFRSSLSLCIYLFMYFSLLFLYRNAIKWASTAVTPAQSCQHNPHSATETKTNNEQKSNNVHCAHEAIEQNASNRVSWRLNGVLLCLKSLQTLERWTIPQNRNESAHLQENIE